MTATRRLYLDNAATSWPKPEAVYQAVNDYLRHNGAPAGRGAYAEATAVGELVAQTRRGIAALIGADDGRRVIFTLNGTDSLNLALHGLLRAGDHVVTTCCEHNSVLRPLRTLEDTGVIGVTRVRCDSLGRVVPDDIAAALRPATRLVVCTHASNVTGAVQPVAEIGRIARRHGALFLLDAAQTLGHWPVHVDELSVDLLAAPGHKALLGPLGTGVFWIRPGVEEFVRSVRQGGTGTQSEDDHHPATLPEKYEAGNLNVAGIAGLAAGVAWIAEQSVARIADHAATLTARFLARLTEIDGVVVHSPPPPENAGVVSLNIRGYDPQEVAATLDSAARIQTRAGLHCAPLTHAALRTDRRGGTVRFSWGAFTTLDDVEAAAAAVAELAAAAL